MKFQLITLSGIKYSADAYSVQLPTASGVETVLPNHEPLMSVLVPGVISIRRNQKDPDHTVEHYATYGGVVEILGDDVRVLVDEADHGDEINEAEAEKARTFAQELLQKAGSQVELEHAQTMVDRQAVRLQVAQLKRRHQRR
jgi:F-type H+-transporting ATPase subunit epsilon